MLALYGHPFSSYTWKARIPLLALGVDHVFRTLDADHPEHGAFVQAAHPAGKFPVLADGETTIVEATAIVEYLAVTRDPGATLIPADPHAAVTVRMLDRVFDNYVMANMQRVVDAHLRDGTNPDPAEIEAGKAGLRRAYAWLEQALVGVDLPPHVSLVSCAAAPSLFYADWVEAIPDDATKLRALRAELLALPAVVTCVDEARPYRAYFPPGAPDRD